MLEEMDDAPQSLESVTAAEIADEKERAGTAS
jgi:hypothetical protein